LKYCDIPVIKSGIQ